MKSKKFCPPGMYKKAEDGMAFGPNWQKELQARLYGQQPINQGDLTALPLNGMHQMPVTPYAPPTEAAQPGKDYSPTPLAQSNQNTPHVSIPSFKTPGTGDIIAGGIGIANMLLPGQEQNPYHKRQYGSYNPYSTGTGSQVIYDDGGIMPGVHNRQRQEGGIRINEEIPNNLGYGATAPQMIQPVMTQQPGAIPRSIAYERLEANGERPVYAPKFNGNWSGRDIQESWKTIPQTFNGQEVLRGQAWDDLQHTTPYMQHMNPALQKQNQFQNAQWAPGYFDQHHNDGRYAKMENGGKLSAGQKIALSKEEKSYYESIGYKFK